MTILRWRGDCQPRPQVTTLTPANVEVGDIFTVTINRKDISVTATAGTVANIVAMLVAAIGDYNNDIAEFAEISASTGTTAGVTTHVVLTGPTDGKPFTITTSTTNAGVMGVTVTTLVAGVATTNEKQRVYLAGPPSGGTFTLTFDGQTTGAIARNASAATVLAALEALSNIAAGDVAVTLNATSDWTVEFIQNFAGVDVPLMTGSGASLTGGATITHATTTNGQAGANEVQLVSHVTTLNQNIRLKFQPSGEVTSFFAGDASAATVQAALEALAPIGAGNVSVSASPALLNPALNDWTVTFIGALANQNIAAMTVPNGNVQVLTITDGSGTTANEVQTIKLNNAPVAGTFTVTFSGQTTAATAFNASAATLTTNLEALSNIGVGDVLVVRSGSGTIADPYIYTVTFQGALAATDVAQMTSSAASLTGSGVSVATTQAAVAGTNEIQEVTLTGSPDAGNFTLTFNAETTANILYNATAATVQTRLEGLATPIAGDFAVAGPDGGPWTVEFKQTYAKTNVAEMTGANVDMTGGGSQTLVASTTTTPTGPNWWGEAENWSTGSAPVNGDIAHLQYSGVDILYGLEDLSGVTLAELHIWQSFTGSFGLPKMTDTGYFEYRPDYVKIGATLAYIGEGDGQGSSRIKLDTSTVQTTILQTNGSFGAESGLPAVIWKGTHASNAASVFKGSFGAAVFGGEVATLSTLKIGYRESIEQDAQVFLGTGVTLTTLDKSGGQADVECAAPSIQQTTGTLRIGGTGNVGGTLFAIRGGTCAYNTTGTLGGTPILSGDGVLDFSQDMRPKVVTNPIDLHGSECRLLDPYKVIAAGSGSCVVDLNEGATAAQVDFGRNSRLTRTAVS